MSKIEDGGPALGCGTMPHPTDINRSVPVSQLSVRDYFAAQAMSGIAGHLSKMLSAEDVSKDELLNGYLAAGMVAYGLADAMLAARQPPTTDKEKD